MTASNTTLSSNAPTSDPNPKPDPDTDSDTSSNPDLSSALFTEPADYYPPPAPPTFISYPLDSGSTLSLRLVGHNPLWGHHLWNSGRVLASYLQTHAESLINPQTTTVLELGAGAGLPALVAGILGARKVVVTDYPDVELVENLAWNVERCKETGLFKGRDGVTAEGYLWGGEAGEAMKEVVEGEDGGFELLILGDLLFNHSEHERLLEAVERNLRRDDALVGEASGTGTGADTDADADASASAADGDGGVRKGNQPKALVFFTPYRPWLLDKDLAFFELAKGKGWQVDKVLETVMPEVMFKEDRGDELLRRTVFGYEMTREQRN